MFSRLFTVLVAPLLSVAVSINSYADTIHESYAFSMMGNPKYSSDFTHFDYTNPAAPKGGKITLSALGTFDSFNAYASRGTAAARSGQLYDTLYTGSDDEIGSYYPLIAESVRYDNNFNWAEVNINANARFQDNSPITAKDVSFSFNKFMTEGVAQFRSFYHDVKVKAISRYTVRIELPKNNKEMMLGLIGGLPIMPESYWQHHKLSEPLTTPPLGSGPYRISDYRLGQYISYTRLNDYWAADLPVNRGRYNFDTIRYDYYLDDNIALEAFKAGEFDLRIETSPKNWATQYIGHNIAKGYIVKQDENNQSAQDSRWLAFNIQRPLFADRRVRQAITLAFDFQWMNKALYYDAYQRANSYFQNTPYAAQGAPSAEELVWLTPLKDKIPAEVFANAYQPPKTDGSGFPRNNLQQAMQLLEKAGWHIVDKKLVNVKTGQPFRFELLLPSTGNLQYVLPFQHSLKQLGIEMQIREVDSSQFINRRRSRDFDMVPLVYNGMNYPESSLDIFWGSAYLKSTWNAPGVQNPAIDQLIAEIQHHQGQPKPLLALGHALDRVLTWNIYMLPMWYSNHDRFAYWNKFSMPSPRPTYALGLDTWWYDVNRAAKLPEQQR